MIRSLKTNAFYMLMLRLIWVFVERRWPNGTVLFRHRTPVSAIVHAHSLIFNCLELKDRDSTAPKRGSVFIGLMTPDGAIWSRYQRAVLMK